MSTAMRVDEGAPGDRRRKNYILSQSLLDEAKAVLGTSTETETIERALRLATFGERLMEGTRRLFGMEWHDPYGEEDSPGTGADSGP